MPGKAVGSTPAGGTVPKASRRPRMGRALAKVGTVCFAGGTGLGSSVSHPLYGVVELSALTFPVIMVLMLAVCLPDDRSERLYRWGRLLLGRSEPSAFSGSRSEDRATHDPAMGLRVGKERSGGRDRL